MANGTVRRKSWTNRQLVLAWEKALGKCWRCKQKIFAPNGKTAVYGEHWHMGHVGRAHWAGGSEYAPEHKSCNMEDAKVQTKLAAKSVRMRARNAGIKKRSKGRPMPGTKRSGWKQKLNGEWVRRDG